MAKKRRSVNSKKSASKKSVNILNSGKNKKCGAISNNTIVKAKQPLRSKRIMNKLIKDNLLPINDKLESINSVYSKGTAVPKIENGRIADIDDTMNILSSEKKKNCKAISSNTIVKKKPPSRAKRIINKPIKVNLPTINYKLESMNTVSSNVTIPNIENDNINISDTIINSNAYEDSQSSKVTYQNIENDSIIDITDTTINSNAYEDTQSSKVTYQNIENDSIIDITDTTIDSNENKDYQSASSKITYPNIENDDIVIDITDIMDNYKDKGWEPSTKTMSSNDDNDDDDDDDDDDVQIVGIHYNNKPIEYITISDDSDEENIPCQQSIQNSVNFTPITNELDNENSNSKALNKSYISPLNKYKKKLNSEIMSKQECLPKNLGPFVIDKRGISKYSKHIRNFSHKGAKFQSAPDKTTDTTSDKTSDTTPDTISDTTPDTTAKANRQLRPIIIDGLNIGHAHGCGKFSVKGIEICIEYFSDRGHKDIVAFLPQHWQNPFATDSNAIMNKLVQNGNICFTPSRKVQNIRMTCYDDRIILNYAHKCKGVVVSNDNYRDLYEESEAFKDIIENRQVMVTFFRNTIIVPDDQYNRKCAVRSLSDILCFPD